MKPALIPNPSHFCRFGATREITFLKAMAELVSLVCSCLQDLDCAFQLSVDSSARVFEGPRYRYIGSDSRSLDLGSLRTHVCGNRNHEPVPETKLACPPGHKTSRGLHSYYLGQLILLGKLSHHLRSSRSVLIHKDRRSSMPWPIAKCFGEKKY